MSKIEQDFLAVDKEIRGQRFVALSFLTPNTITMSDKNKKIYDNFVNNVKEIVRNEFLKMEKDGETYEKFKNLVIGLIRPDIIGLLDEKYIKFKDFYGIKVRGSFNDKSECDAHCAKLGEIDPSTNAYTGDVGKWLPLDDNPERAEKSVYANNPELNEYMQSYLEQQEKANIMFEKRKAEMSLESIRKSNATKSEADILGNNNSKKDKKNKNKKDEKSEKSDVSVLTDQTLDELEKELLKAKRELENAKKSVKDLPEFENANNTYKYLNRKVNEKKLEDEKNEKL